MTQKHASNPSITDRWAYLWLGIAFVLAVFTYGMYRNPLAALLAPVFLIRFMRSKKTGIGFLLVFLALAVANIISWWDVMPTFTVPARIIMGVIAGFLYSIPLLLDRVLVRRFQGFAATLVFPLASAAFDFLTSWPNPMSTYGSIANSFFSIVYLTQLASITGLWGVTFLVSWFASLVNWIWEEGAAWQRIWRGVTVYAGIMLVVLLYGVVRLTYFLPQSGTVRMHGIVETDYTRKEWDTVIGPLSDSDPAAFRARLMPLYERYLQSTIREAQGGAQFVVWPEVAIEGYPEDVEAVVAQAQEIARQENIYLAIGVNLIASNAEYTGENRLIIIDPQGEIVLNHLKYGCTAINMYEIEVQTVDTPYGRLGGVLCCDLDYPYVIRQASQKGVDMLIVPSFEPTSSNLVAHAQMVPFRAIENGVSIFRPTAQGISLAIDPYGRQLGAMNDTTADQAVLVAQLPNQRIFTIYSVIGDLAGWLFVVGFLVIVGWAIYRSRKVSVKVAALPEAESHPA